MVDHALDVRQASLGGKTMKTEQLGATATFDPLEEVNTQTAAARAVMTRAVKLSVTLSVTLPVKLPILPPVTLLLTLSVTQAVLLSVPLSFTWLARLLAARLAPGWAVRMIALLVVVCAGMAPVNGVSAEVLPADRAIAEVIDHYIDAKIKAAGVTPAPPADDATWVRRATLDLAGRIPTADEARRFVASTDPQKRQQWIDRLAASPWFDRHTASELNTLLRGLDGSGPDLRKYLIAAVKENRPWNQVFRELLGEGTDPLGPEQFIVKRVGDADLLTRDVSSMFFGINITCCQCHTHPYVATLTQDYFYGMKAFFARSYEFQGRLMERRFAPAKLQFKDRAGENREVSMMFLSGESLATPDPGVPDLAKAIAEESKEIEALRKEFAKNKAYPPTATFSTRGELLKLADKPANQSMMARAFVNRLWLRLFGHGLVMRVDQMHGENPGSHPELLEWLARDLIAHQWNWRRTVSGLIASTAYARGSRWNGPPPARELFAVAELRPLTPMQFGLSVLVASDPGLDAAFVNATPDDLDKKISELETRAQGFAGTLFETPLVEGFQINVREPLAISNDPARLKAIGAALIPALQKLPDTRQQIELATWSVLSRPPIPEEVGLLSEYLAAPSQPPATTAPATTAPATTAPAASTPAAGAPAATPAGTTPAASKPPEAKTPATVSPATVPPPMAPTPAVPSDVELRRRALEQVVWALVAGSEFRFNH